MTWIQLDIDVQTRGQKAILKPREELLNPHSVHIPRTVECYGIGVYNDAMTPIHTSQLFSNDSALSIPR